MSRKEEAEETRKACCMRWPVMRIQGRMHGVRTTHARTARRLLPLMGSHFLGAWASKLGPVWPGFRVLWLLHGSDIIAGARGEKKNELLPSERLCERGNEERENQL